MSLDPSIVRGASLFSALLMFTLVMLSALALVSPPVETWLTRGRWDTSRPRWHRTLYWLAMLVAGVLIGVASLLRAGFYRGVGETDTWSRLALAIQCVGTLWLLVGLIVLMRMRAK